MDIKGRAELLLGLLVSSLLLCQNGASGRTCVPGSKCHLMLQELYQNAVYLSHSMYFYALDLFFQLTGMYLHRPGYFSAAKKLCHTADILTPDERQDAKLMPKEDIMKVVFHLVDSWNEALQELVREENQPPKFHRILSTKEQKIYLKYQELKRAIVQIALQNFPEEQPPPPNTQPSPWGCCQHPPSYACFYKLLPLHATQKDTAASHLEDTFRGEGMHLTFCHLRLNCHHPQTLSADSKSLESQ
ncbi:Prolactin [Fukomys damarensis]|uniref:Prolactin n=1 Tax=Fukomys damarensis TaxID=885580 RepID=A0A091DAY9_FUKDA|nr:Prolactin [Fukomys damarensis]